jgi:ParB-like chromosome segregation protein Spo0J
MTKKSKKPTYDTWPIERLRPHERQAANYANVNDRELDRLMAVMSTGRYDPIEVDPSGRMIDGHQRYRAAKKLGLKEVRVKIRHDLAGDEAAIELRHLQANEFRRQEAPLDRARNARRMRELECGRELRYEEMSEVADEVVALIGCSRKHALRLLKITGLPMEIQAAVTDSRVTMLDAEKVAQLDERVHERIAGEIRDGGTPKEVVRKYLPRKKRVARDLGAELDRIVEVAERAREVLDGRESEIRRSGTQCERDLSHLRWLLGFIKVTIPQLKAQQARSEEFDRALEEIELRRKSRPRP